MTRPRRPFLALLLLASTAANAHKAPPPPPPPPVITHPGTLIDHVNGLTLDDANHLQHFTALTLDADGHVTALLQPQDARPRMTFALDAHGATLVPGLVAGQARLVATGLAMISGGTPLSALPAPRPEDRDLAFATLEKALLARGITTATDVGTTIEDWQVYRRAGDTGRLLLHVVAYADGLAQMIVIGGPNPGPWLYDGRLKFAGVWLPIAAAPDRHPNWSAVALGQPAAGPNAEIQLKNELSRAAMDHFQPMVGAPDAAAIHLALDAIADLTETYGTQRGWRIATPPPPPPQDTERLAPLGATLTPPDALSAAPDSLAPSLADPAPAPYPAALTADMLAARTAQPAQSARVEAHLGRLTPGHDADFLLLDADPTGATAPHLLETWVSGRFAWSASGKTAMGALAPDQK